MKFILEEALREASNIIVRNVQLQHIHALFLTLE